MKNAVFYARVSSDKQRKDGTIKSQVDALKNQIKKAKYKLVKEYVDEGWSGARLDRPALSSLMSDIKTDLFEIVYFLNADRIARDVTYQNLIISEIIKNGKKIIINNKEYSPKPENKFNLTVLGAVSELERAKIIERSRRGTLLKVKNGNLGSGVKTLGYDYITKQGDTSGRLAVNKKEAEIVRFIFTEYAKPEVSLSMIVKMLEVKGYKTKNGKEHWDKQTIRNILRNTTYHGVRYYNKYKMVELPPDNPSEMFQKPKTKTILRDKKDWIPVKTPAIISKELFNKAFNRIEFNCLKYQNQRIIWMLNDMLKCGKCGGNYFAARHRYSRNYPDGKRYYNNKGMYRCGGMKTIRHNNRSKYVRCNNTSISCHILDAMVWQMIKGVMLKPNRLLKHTLLFNHATHTLQDKYQNELSGINRQIIQANQKRTQIIDLYTSENLSEDVGVNIAVNFDQKIIELENRRNEIIRSAPALQKLDIMEDAIREHCENATTRFEKCNGLDSKRQFLADYIEKVVFNKDSITITGSAPIKLNPVLKKQFVAEDIKDGKVDFYIEQPRSMYPNLGMPAPTLQKAYQDAVYR